MKPLLVKYQIFSLGLWHSFQVPMLGQMPSVPLSPFGCLVLKHLRATGLAKMDLARAAGLTDTAAMTRCLRRKGSGDPKAYSPPPAALVPWADLLHLTGKERRTFIALGLLDRCTRKDAEQLWRELGLPGEMPEPSDCD